MMIMKRVSLMGCPNDNVDDYNGLSLPREHCSKIMRIKRGVVDQEERRRGGLSNICSVDLPPLSCPIERHIKCFLLATPIPLAIIIIVSIMAKCELWKCSRHISLLLGYIKSDFYTKLSNCFSLSPRILCKKKTAQLPVSVVCKSGV